MQSALRIETKVLPGNKIEITLPDDTLSTSVGQTIEVIVLIPQKTTLEGQSIMHLLEEIHKQRPVGRSVEEINQDLQAERDAWDN
ncbi:hypothetical protein VF14_14835 [Nostoc linckia z18]|jgi:hypothetical protein|uniref:Uncharacterized protein n=2 Tax=Nostoc linckia TaxID=92942 RepID=A0A9Q5ZAG8_NOSLI|nr:hypothetical protein [Nostoc linckia]PHK39811.1 hypothetical protein VF12_12780 [Nostoc linckia z15]PHK46573.1 hypothetical protein VF13_10260 [Nostoc linckia z16]PHJ60441.1 hypothetical protein VF02_22310 [Nostoc linckia z1]PHJ63986.1 hypothetical protein VF05_23280 [Nostoc linckia z3]PHJ76387.1 hypothetical protein VF03_07845 [Nostoc linckia z2]